MTLFPLTDATTPGVPRPPPNPPPANAAAPPPVGDADAPPNPPFRPARANPAAPASPEIPVPLDAERCPYQIPADVLVTTRSARAKTAVYLFVHL